VTASVCGDPLRRDRGQPGGKAKTLLQIVAIGCTAAAAGSAGHLRWVTMGARWC